MTTRLIETKNIIRIDEISDLKLTEESNLIGLNLERMELKMDIPSNTKTVFLKHDFASVTNMALSYLSSSETEIPMNTIFIYQGLDSVKVADICCALALLDTPKEELEKKLSFDLLKKITYLDFKVSSEHPPWDIFGEESLKTEFKELRTFCKKITPESLPDSIEKCKQWLKI